MSLRRPRDPKATRRVRQETFPLESIAPAACPPGTPPPSISKEKRVDSTHQFDGLHIERLSWQLAGGPRTEALFLKPAGAVGPLPGILALHDHGGNKFLGWRKIARIDDQTWPRWS